MARYVIDNIPAPIDWECEDSITKRTLQNAKNLLCTVRGEVPYVRVYGIDPAIFDMPAQEARENVERVVGEALKFEVDVQLISAEIVFNGADTPVIRAEIEIDLEE